MCTLCNPRRRSEKIRRCCSAHEKGPDSAYGTGPHDRSQVGMARSIVGLPVGFNHQIALQSVALQWQPL